MKTFVVLAAAALGIGIATANAVDAPKSDWVSESGKLTVLQVINAADALRQLGTYHDKNGMIHEVPFKFSGTVLMATAANIDAADRVSKNYETAFNALRHQMGLDVPLDKDADKAAREAYARKTSDFGAQIEKMQGSPAGAMLARIKVGELCIEDPPVAPCKVTNAIPPSILAAIWPIIER